MVTRRPWADSFCVPLGEDRHHEAVSERGHLSSLIYGTVKGQKFDKELARSSSQVLARGKYVHSIVMHDVKPNKVDEYVDLVGQWYPRMANIEENRVNLVGSWRTQVGDNDTFSKFQLNYSSRKYSIWADHLFPK